jgi:glycosyltransferase involved in cell wall biosynthesis
MLTNSRVSLIIPIHGKGLYLADTLKSVEMIGYQNLEVLLVLDRADQKAREMAVNFCNKRGNRFILESINPGISEALNLGIERATGIYIARLDSDDMISPDRISKQVMELDTKTDLVLVGTQMLIIDNFNSPIRYTCYPIKDRSIKNLMQIRNCIGHPTVMLRKESVEKVGGYRSEFNGAEDLDMWLRLSRLGKFMNINSALTSYRISDNQVTNSLKKQPGELEERVLIENLLHKRVGKNDTELRRISSRDKIKLRAIRLLWRFDSQYKRGFVSGIPIIVQSLLIYPTGTLRFCIYAIRLKKFSRIPLS